MARKFVPLKETAIEGVENKGVVVLGCVREVRPVESVGHVHLVDAGTYMSCVLLFWIASTL